MNLDIIKTKLDRLNRFYEFMAAQPANISDLDKDSFLMQLRELYMVAVDSKSTSSEDSKGQKIMLDSKGEKEKKVVQEKEFVADTVKKPTKKGAKIIFNTTKEMNEDKKEVKPIITKKEQPKVEPIIFESTEKKEPILEKPAIAKIESEKEHLESNLTQIEKTGSNEVSAISFNEAYEELFLHKQATDLAAKLSEAPIKDLSEKLSINEKLRYINELFAGDVAQFNSSIDFLNKANSFAAARTFMEGQLVGNYDWMNKNKKSLAKDFIKFVRRRYL